MRRMAWIGVLVWVGLGLLVGGLPAAAQESKPVQLLAPQMEGGKPLMQALRERATSRAFSPEKLPDQTLSNYGKPRERVA